MKSLPFMLCHALLTTGENANARVAFVFDSGVQAREAFSRLQEAADCIGGYYVNVYTRTIQHVDGGSLQVRWVTTENVQELSGCQWSHLYHLHDDPKVIQFLECRIRVTHKDFKVPPGLYTKYGARIYTDY